MDIFLIVVTAIFFFISLVLPVMGLSLLVLLAIDLYRNYPRKNNNDNQRR